MAPLGAQVLLKVEYDLEHLPYGEPDDNLLVGGTSARHAVDEDEIAWKEIATTKIA